MGGMDVGIRIKAWREAKGMSRQELADRVPRYPSAPDGETISVAAVYQWEGTGESKTTPSVPHLEAVVAAFGITMERFYGRIPKAKAAS